MVGIFISYRRETDSAAAGRLHDALVQEFGAEHVFTDVDRIRLGQDFVKVLERTWRRLTSSWPVIGRGWAEVTDGDGRRRLESPQDFVRLEVARALERWKTEEDMARAGPPPATRELPQRRRPSDP